MALSILEKINIGAVSESYCVTDILKSGLYGGGIDVNLPRKIYCLRKSIQWMYDLSNADTTLTKTTNYLISLCGKYYLSAQTSLIGNGVVASTSGSGYLYLIPITGASFTTATAYNDTRIVGKNLAIFWNDVNRYLLASEFSYTLTGIDITIAGFDALANPTIELFIYIIY